MLPTMNIVHAAALLAAGLAAGTVNAVAGGGSLITFPTLLALGYPALLANVSNNIGLVPGNFSGVYGYRKELQGQRRRVLALGSASLIGGIIGGILLLTLPPAARPLSRTARSLTARGNAAPPRPSSPPASTSRINSSASASGSVTRRWICCWSTSC